MRRWKNITLESNIFNIENRRLNKTRNVFSNESNIIGKILHILERRGNIDRSMYNNEDGRRIYFRQGLRILLIITTIDEEFKCPYIKCLKAYNISKTIDMIYRIIKKSV